MSQRAGTHFVINLDGVHLPEEVTRRISARLQSAFLEEIAQLDLAPKLVFRIPKPWPGLWIDELSALKVPAVPEVMVEVRR
jgi:hypothetical protein